jgi:ribosome-associated protein
MAESTWRGHIPSSAIIITAARSSGAGGQNVNKRSTKAEVTFFIGTAGVLSQNEQAKLIAYCQKHRPSILAGMDDSPYLLVTAMEHRTFERNKATAIQKLVRFITKALTEPKKRKQTRPSKASIEERLRSKKKRSGTKRLRQSKIE